MNNYIHCVGCRPNLVKLKALHDVLGGYILHTGQHPNPAMSNDILKELELGTDPVYYQRITASRLPDMIAEIVQTLHMKNVTPRYEDDVFIIVYGDTDSALAGALAAMQSRWSLNLVHVEAGLRCGDLSMPEERNRIVIDHLADYLFCNTAADEQNLVRESVKGSKWVVGNTMVDTLKKFEHLLKPTYDKSYCLLTLHRPANVDSEAKLEKIMTFIEFIPRTFVMPVHPRIEGKFWSPKNVIKIPPQGYVDFLSLQKYAQAIVTDSGGVQEESTMLNVPCITLRPSTERPITITHGTNELCKGLQYLEQMIEAAIVAPKKAKEIEGWDGKAAERIAEVLRHA